LLIALNTSHSLLSDRGRTKQPKQRRFFTPAPSAAHDPRVDCVVRPSVAQEGFGAAWEEVFPPLLQSIQYDV
jgi:hypothetical protein